MWSIPQVTITLSKGALLFPAIIAIGVLLRDRLVLAIAPRDQ